MPDPDPQAPSTPPPAAHEGVPRRTRIVVEPQALWRPGLVVIGLIILYSFGSFVLHDGGSVLFQIIMAWLASIAMEPAVSRLARHMRRGLATGVVMLGVVVFAVLFTAAFGNLLVTQAVNLIQGIPTLLASLATWVNQAFGTTFDAESLLESLQITPQTLASLGVDVAGGLIGVIVAILGGVFSLFSIGLFIFYFSADAPRLQRWVAHLLPPHRQEVFIVVWGLAVKKTGGYVAARVVLAAICGGLTAIFLLIIGMPYWLALGVWTGVVSQFVPSGHLHRDRAAGRRRADQFRAGRRRPRAGLCVGVPADREPHDRAEDQRRRRRHAPGGGVRGGPVRRRAVRGGGSTGGRPDLGAPAVLGGHLQPAVRAAASAGRRPTS
jgi:hypothetical protein